MAPETRHWLKSMTDWVLSVRDPAAAVRWYTTALGAQRGSGYDTYLTVEGNDFWIAHDQRAVEPGNVTIFVGDPDRLVARAVAAGATADAAGIRDRAEPWGSQRRGEFVDPFGHRWIVSDESPLRSHGPGRVHHMDYITTVVDQLVAAGMRIGYIIDRSTDTPSGPGSPRQGERTRAIIEGDYHLGEQFLDDDWPKRAALIYIDNWRSWPWAGYDDMEADLRWDEEYAWVVTKTDEAVHSGPGRGRWESRYALGLGLVPDPTEVALDVALLFNDEWSRYDPRPRLLRGATTPDPVLEAALSAYLPG